MVHNIYYTGSLSFWKPSKEPGSEAGNPGGVRAEKGEILEPDGTSGKERACQCRRCKNLGFDLWVRKIPWRRKWQPTPVFLPEESHGQRSLAGTVPWGRRVGHD